MSCERGLLLSREVLHIVSQVDNNLVFCGELHIAVEELCCNRLVTGGVT